LVDAVLMPDANCRQQRPASASTESGGLVASSVYAGGKHVADIPVDKVGAWSRRPGHVVWIGLVEPRLDLLQRVGEQLELHPLAIEDAGKSHQHPKIEQYGNSLFIVVAPAR
jgi:magnesium transporter